MNNDTHTLSLDEAIEHCEAIARTLTCNDCAEDHRQLARWLRELKRYKEIEKSGLMPKPKSILRLTHSYHGYRYACPFCNRGVSRKSGILQCRKCGGIVDNDTFKLASILINVDDYETSWM